MFMWILYAINAIIKRASTKIPPLKLVIVPFCMYVFQYGLGWSMIHDPLWQYRTSVGDDEQLRRYDAFGASGPLLIAMKIFLP